LPLTGPNSATLQGSAAPACGAGAIPLFTHTAPDAPLAYRNGAAIRAGRFLADVRRLAVTLPPGAHVLNVCADRYLFAVGLAACLLTKKITLLPSTHTPETIRQLAALAPDAYCLTDDPDCDIALTCVHVTPDLQAPACSWEVPAIDAGQTAAILYTSGSTGAPTPHRKTWGGLARCVRAGAARLGHDDGRSYTLIGTVPAQHMYGFETTVLLALQSGNAFCAERPFYPADICAVVAAAPRPRVLVSTPIHLRMLLAAGIVLPPVDLVVSATAPLAQALAHDVEQRFETTLLEIYGSTETGQTATRRTACADPWRLWPDVRIRISDGRAFAEGGHVAESTLLCDVIEMTGSDEFLLHGRTADLVNIAGKRSSFAYLNHQLNAIPGVIDGIFFQREQDTAGSSGVARLAAMVVAPGLTSAALTEELRQRIDPVFLPRPLLFVDRLPRNATGKLPQQSVELLVAQHVKSSRSS
jgi:acyl-coenzyme A synthetase/AMP-(fatty) acid ligase